MLTNESVQKEETDPFVANVGHPGTLGLGYDKDLSRFGNLGNLDQ